MHFYVLTLNSRSCLSADSSIDAWPHIASSDELLRCSNPKVRWAMNKLKPSIKTKHIHWSCMRGRYELVEMSQRRVSVVLSSGMASSTRTGTD